MRRLLTAASLLLAGVATGWWLRALAPEVLPHAPQVSAPSPYQAADTISAHYPPAAPGISDADASQAPAPTKPPETAIFRQLLEHREYQQALLYYEDALAVDDDYQPLLKPALEDHLGANLRRCKDGAFVELADIWLDTYYEDIPVLLLLAENQRMCSSPEEAARTLQIASTYALRPGLQESVGAALGRLITATDNSLSQQQRWIELLGFYEFLKTIDLATRSSELRRAALYQLIGEHQRSQSLLSALRESDNGLDPEWTATLDLQWDNSVQGSSADQAPTQALPLTRRGDHFLVTLAINDNSQATLMIDTGASLTTLSRASFELMDSRELDYLGSRLFNTGNGVTPGAVYQTASVTLGTTRINAPEIAVLDFESPAGVDGLLGMNVLRNFHFEIDQDAGVLYLRARQ